MDEEQHKKSDWDRLNEGELGRVKFGLGMAGLFIGLSAITSVWGVGPVTRVILIIVGLGVSIFSFRSLFRKK